MNWQHCFLDLQECWISGIYKVITYGRGEYHAFYIRDEYKNWGDYVAPPPDTGHNGHRCWLSLDGAKRACEEHAASHKPKPSTAKRAEELLAASNPIEVPA